MLEKLITSSFQKGYLHFSEKGFFTRRFPPGDEKERRIVWGEVFEWCVRFLKEKGGEQDQARLYVRSIFNEECKGNIPWNLPAIIAKDGFMRSYAQGKSFPLALLKRVYKKLETFPPDFSSSHLPPVVGRTENHTLYYDVKATPPGLLPKFLSSHRIKKDPVLLSQVQSDLRNISLIDDPKRRMHLAIALLAYGAAYRELEGEILFIPSFVQKQKGILLPYAFRHHFLWEGIKTVSASPLENEHEEPGLYLCQGTEIWPSQPATLGSLHANLGKEGPATEPYAKTWRQVHRHLKDLHKEGGPLPIVLGHSMGGAFATQIAIYSHSYLSEAYAFNPPVVEERDYKVFHRLSKEVRAKLKVFANLDDLPFWRIGSKVIGGEVTIFLTARRWRYRPLRTIEILLIIPALVKTFINVVEAFPSHQSIYPLSEQYVEFPLSEKEVEEENLERVKRPDHLYFFHKLHPSTRTLLSFSRRYFGWKKYEDYLKSQLEIVNLHEEELLNTLGNEENTKRVLDEIETQKGYLLNELRKLKK